MEEILRAIYYDPSTGFGGLKKLYKTAKAQGHSFTMKEVKSFYDKQEIVQQSKKPNAQGSFIPQRKLQEIQIDLVFYGNTVLNKYFTAVLTAIDVFSKKAFAIFIKKKTAEANLAALKVMIKELGKPEMIYSDRGGEFDNKLVKDWMIEEGIDQVFTHTHAPFIERFNRTLKEMTHKYLESTGTKTVTNVLSKIVANYNNTVHGATKYTPNKVHSMEAGPLHDEVFVNITKRAKVVKRPTLKKGDSVRTVVVKSGLDKGYEATFSKDVKTVGEVDGFRYKVMGRRHPHLRAHMLKVGAKVQKNTLKADLEGTLEGRLKQKGGLKASQKNFHKVADETAAEERVGSRSSRRKAQQARADKAMIARLKSQGWG